MMSKISSLHHGVGEWQLVTDSSGLPIGITFKGQATNLLNKDLRRRSIAKIHAHDNVLNITMVLLL
jgi:hypothetical protein